MGTSKWVGVALLSAWRCYGASLLVAGIAKTLAPWMAAAALQWLGGSLTQRSFLVTCVSIVELVVGALVLKSVNRWVVVAGGALGLLFALGRAMQHFAAGAAGACGCFGEIVVADGVALGCGIVGMVVGSALLWRSEGHSRVERGLLSSALVALTVGIILSMLVRPSPSKSTLRQFIAAEEWNGGGVGVVGSMECDDCRKVLYEIGERMRSKRFPCAHVALVVRASDGGLRSGQYERFAPWLYLVEVPDAVWWAWIDKKPPTLVAWGSDLEPTAVSELPRTLVRDAPSK